MKLADHVFLVTGGASGLGEATVRRFVAAGARAVIADFNEARGQAVADELGEAVRFIKCDVGAAADAEAAVKAAIDAFGRIDGVINCAGIGTPAKAVGKGGPLPLEQFERVIRVNLTGSFNMIRVAAAAMQEQTANDEGERGVIINTASVAAYDGQIGQPAYAASKAGVVGMTLPLAREFARAGIRVVTIAPGLFITPMMESLPAEAQASLGSQVPFPSRLGRPEEYAQLAQSIVENAMLNGETIRLDGAIRMAPR
ncbi:SDR family NAD(P)-dependent oxidoreductase [Flagellatimonas centrodinii]|uniref:SDR family NAD(P)-dependent oxidoreductase n=1 Tax=Flagellatimonas centrodinii TaxID=2806210 RepID=UPI001FEE4EB2|nr:SDR family NAD(P)-dependent oxidoreductase [Flagellatimonas centrodinii]ULQ47647.1 SDR family NAD(P)-dependent oxidoreductase [Flagellatimonas centrodinii]